MTGPLAIACDFHAAPVGTCCIAETCCARRITRALMIEAGVGDASERARAATRGDPGKAPSPVVEDPLHPIKNREPS